MTTSSSVTEVIGVENYKVRYERKKILGGLISWYVKVSAEKLHNDLIINTTQEFDKIILNGKKIC